MKIQFEDPQRTQTPASTAQSRMRAATPKRFPVLTVMVVMAGLIASGYAAFVLWNSRTIYASGVVASSSDELVAPHRGVVTQLNVVRGDHVIPGQVLLMLAGGATEQERVAIDSVHRELERYAEERAALQQSAIELAEAELRGAEAELAQSNADRLLERELAAIEAGKLASVAEQRRSRWQRMRELYERGAAVRSDVDLASQQYELAAREAEQAAARVRHVEDGPNPLESRVEAARLDAARVRDVGSSSLEGVQRANLELELARSSPAPTPLQAKFEGVVLELATAEGAQVRDAQPLMTVVRTDRTWVDAYVPERSGRELAAGKRASIYLPGEPHTAVGTVYAAAGSAVPVPTQLRAEFPGVTSVYYVRIAVDSDVALVPGTVVRVTFER